MKDSISRWSLHYEGWAAEHNISCLPRGNRSRGKGLSLLSPCRGGAPPFSPALPSYSVSLLFLLFAPAVTKPHSGRFSSAFRPFCSANPAAGSRNMQGIFLPTPPWHPTPVFFPLFGLAMRVDLLGSWTCLLPAFS